MTLNGSLPQDCTSTGTNPITVTCNLGTVNAGQTVSRTINVTASDMPGQISNTATVSSPRDRTNSSGTEETTVVAEADLSITKVDDRDPVPVSGNFTYTLSVSNATGAGQATDVVVRDELPEGVTLNGPLPAGCTSSGTDPITATCELGSIEAGQTVTIDIDVTAPGTPQTLSNTVTVSSPSDRTNASDTEETTVVVKVELSVIKEDDPDPVDVGDNLTYTLTMTNEGPNDATGVTVTDELPEGVEFVSAEASQGGTDACDEQAGVVACNLGDIGNGDTATVEIVVTPTAVGTIENTAEVSSATDDPDTTNNEATESTTVDENGDGDAGDGGDEGDNDSDGEEGDDGDNGNGDKGDNDGGDNGDDGNNDVLEDGVDVTEDDKIEDRTGQPDGEVVDTSNLSQLPNTGGPNLITGGALIAGLALLSAGVGVSAWRFSRGRSAVDVLRGSPVLLDDRKRSRLHFLKCALSQGSVDTDN